MSLLKGWFGEKKTAFKLWLWLDGKTYKRFHNLIIPANNGTTQIDHLLISPFGCFIIETKNYKGWIFGSESQPKWTLAFYKNKYSFQNPIRQTFRQKKVLSEFLDIDESTIHTIVYFVGDCKFKTKLPANVMKSGLRRYIKRFRIRILSIEDINRTTELVKSNKSNRKLTNRRHVRSLLKRHASKTICPNCGSNLVTRTAKKGPNSSLKFLGCESFPKCRFTKRI